MAGHTSTLWYIERNSLVAERALNDLVRDIINDNVSLVDVKDRIVAIQGKVGSIEQAAQEITIALRDVLD